MYSKPMKRNSVKDDQQQFAITIDSSSIGFNFMKVFISYILISDVKCFVLRFGLLLLLSNNFRAGCVWTGERIVYSSFAIQI